MDSSTLGISILHSLDCIISLLFQVSRPSFGHHVSALAVDGPFMVCGGGVELGIWHLGSLSLASVLESTVPGGSPTLLVDACSGGQ